MKNNWDTIVFTITILQIHVILIRIDVTQIIVT